MADGEVLKRLGGGRWKTADDRFMIEPQSGSWVVVDTQQTDDLGLPLVRGPFASLTAARAAIDTARAGDAPISPLAARVEEARLHPPPARPAAKVGSAPAIHAAATTRTKAVAKERPTPPEPPPPPEPAWIGGLPAARRAVARRLIGRLADAGIQEAEAVARAEVEGGEPAVARVALERQLRATERRVTDRKALVAGIIELLVAGEDRELQVRWRLVDGEDRSMAPLPGAGRDGS